MNTKPASILIVDDNAVTRDILAVQLEAQGHLVVTAVSGQDAITQLDQCPIDLILLDIIMPEMDGFELLSIIKEHELYQYIPVIILSSLDDMESMVRGIEMGAEDFMLKSGNAKLLNARINASLEKKRLHDKEQTRLAELSVLQEIDRELNHSLEMKRAMEITLDWAVKRTHAQAGLMATLADDRIEVVTAQGYTYELYEHDQELLLDSLPALQTALEEERLVCLGDTSGAGLLIRTRSQIALPIYRETAVIAILLLESPNINQWNGDATAFLSRLGSHAAIAIANAQLYEAVQSANDAKTEFVSFVSHELKNPMTSIKGHAKLLVSGDFGEINNTQSEFLQTIQNNVDRMDRLVSDLTDISRMESGKVKLNVEKVSLTEITEDIVTTLQAQIDQKQQIVNIDYPEELPPLFGDRTRLSQILLNLVSNAHKYTPENGHIQLHAEEMNSFTETAELRPMIHLSVKDDGIGIKEEEKMAIFSKYFRTSDTEVLKAPGTGLGLNITRNLVDLHDGRIWFESEYEKGTTFHVVLPVAPPQSLNGSSQ